MIYKTHYIQYNDLVFHDPVAEDAEVSFKETSASYTFGHGNYSPNKGMFVEPRNVPLNLRLRLKKIPCEYRQFYIDYVQGQLSEPGKLWAIKNNTLVWAYAKVRNYVESVDSGVNALDIDVTFRLYEGVWHKADLQRTFLKPFDICEFMDCEGFKELNPCQGLGEDCCVCGEPMDLETCDCCECLEKEMALCYHKDELQSFYDCDPKYKIIYSCESGKKFFGKIGQRFCTDNGFISGRLYSNTNIPTSLITIRFSGEVHNPYIEINGNGNKISGSYTDLTIHSDGSLSNCSCSETDVDNWLVPEGNTYGWEVHQGYNRINIETGNCGCYVCAYIDVDALVL